MPAYRFFINQPLEQDALLTIEGEEFKHLSKVMRLTPDTTIEVVNGSGQFANAHLTNIGKKEAHLKIVDLKVYKRSYDLKLLVGLPKPNHLDVILEKATELGATEIQIFCGERSVGELPQSRIERLKLKAIAALKQCGRLFLPEITLIDPIAQWKPIDYPGYFGDLSYDSKPFTESAFKKIDKMALCVGPEAGFSNKEAERLRELGFEGVSLHYNILRAETASIAFVTLATHLIFTQMDGPVIN